MCTKLNYFTSGSLGVVVLEGSRWMSSVSEDKIINIHRDMKTGSVTVFYYSKNGYDFSKSSNKINMVVDSREYNSFILWINFCMLWEHTFYLNWKRKWSVFCVQSAESLFTSCIDNINNTVIYSILIKIEHLPAKYYKWDWLNLEVLPSVLRKDWTLSFLLAGGPWWWFSWYQIKGSHIFADIVLSSLREHILKQWRPDLVPFTMVMTLLYCTDSWRGKVAARARTSVCLWLQLAIVEIRIISGNYSQFLDWWSWRTAFFILFLALAIKYWSLGVNNAKYS